MVEIINTFSLKEKKKKLATTMRQLTVQEVAADRRKKKKEKENFTALLVQKVIANITDVQRREEVPA